MKETSRTISGLAMEFLPALEYSKKNFYPTPASLAMQMFQGIDFATVGSILEPSAGKGDLVRAVIEKLDYARHNYAHEARDYDIDCIELDPDLRAILKDRGFRVVHDDFLSFETFKQYSLILMNPPFDQGAEHLLKALRMQEKGGAVVCLLNAETIKNPCTMVRKELSALLNQHGAQVTYMQNAFMSSARQSAVEIALVRCVIPYREDTRESSILDNLRKTHPVRTEKAADQANPLAKGDFVEAIIDRFNFEAAAGLCLIDEYLAMLPYFKSSLDEKDRYSHSIISLKVEGSKSENSSTLSNAYLRETRKKYWSTLFHNPDFTKSLTNNLQEELYASIEKLSDYDFSMFNIMQIRIDMSRKMIGGIEETILRLFDDWTRKYHWDEHSENIHYFSGWRTNDAFAVNRKVIIPLYENAWNSWDGRFEPTDYKIVRALEDIEKVFDFLDGSLTASTFIRSRLEDAQKAGQSRKIPLKYFTVTFFKKGTCHVEFTNLDVLKKFNLFAAREKNWLPPCYGRKQYKDLSREEKNVIDSFEGEESYKQVMANATYFLGEIQPLALMVGSIGA